MPRLINLETATSATGYKYSFTPIQDLPSTEYTLINLVVDRSGSVAGFQTEIEKLLGNVVEALKSPDNPRSDNMLLKIDTFNQSMTELHGYKEALDCDPSDYLGKLDPKGTTALHDAVMHSVASVEDYARQLKASDYLCNGLVIVATDGDDNKSRYSLQKLVESVKKARTNESLDSLLVILVGVNMVDSYIASKLKDIETSGAVDNFISLNDASPRTLQKLAKFIVSQSISSSQSLGTGASKALTF